MMPELLEDLFDQLLQSMFALHKKLTEQSGLPASQVAKEMAMAADMVRATYPTAEERADMPPIPDEFWLKIGQMERWRKPTEER